MDYHYDNNIFKRLARRRRRLLFAGSVFLTAVLIVGLVIYDGLTAPTTISDPIESEVTLGESVEQIVFDKPTYLITTTAQWEEVIDEGDKNQGDLYYYLEDGQAVAQLKIYVNEAPREMPVSYVTPVETEAGRLVPLGISPKCEELQPNRNNKRDITLSWAGVEFLCDPDIESYIVAASHNETGTGIEIQGQFSDATYVFEYRDYRDNTQSGTFHEILRDFKAK